MGEPIVSVNSTADLLDLSPPPLPTEQVGPKGWIRTMLLFKLAQDYDMDVLSDVLRTAFSNFKARVPIAGCEAVPAATGSLGQTQAGLVQFRRYGDDEIRDFVVKDLRADAAVPTFSELAARGFPSSALVADKFCLRGLRGEWPKPGDRINVVMVQANFVQGGLALNTLIMHAYADGTTAYKFTELLAEDVRRAQGLAVPQPAEIPVADRAKLMQAHPAPKQRTLAGKPEHHPEYIELPFTPTALPPKLLAEDDHVGHVFHFAPAKMAALRAITAPANAIVFAKEAKDVPFLSTNDIVTALVWRSVQAAQNPDIVAGKTTETQAAPSIVGVALDARRRASVPIHRHTIGNVLGFAAAVLPLATLLREASLADVAIAVRRAVASTSNGSGYLDSLTTWVGRLEDVSRLTPTMFLDMPGHHMLMSSWAEFPYYDIEWGPALGDRVQAVRPPNVGVCHSFQIRLPENPANPGVEMFVCAFKDDMERLLKDPLWTEFAGKPVDSYGPCTV